MTTQTELVQGAVNDGVVYLTGSFPSVEGNDPERVCRDIQVANKKKCSPRVIPEQKVKTATFIDQALGMGHDTVPNKYSPPSLRGPRVEHTSRPEMLGLKYMLGGTSLFFQTVHTCFANHHQLALSPEVLMYLVLHEVAVTVKQHPTDYAALFTKRTDGQKELIRVEHNGLRLGDPASPWHEVLDQFNTGLAARVPDGIMAHALPPFSTHTVETQAASLVAFMDAASPYYAYRCQTMCGIPGIRLLGQAEDYKKLLNACASLAEVFEPHLGTYFKHLLPVLRKIADQAAGAPLDNDFWSSIYKHLDGSGTDDLSGWIATFINYISEPEKGLVPKKDRLYDWTAPDQGWPSGIPRAYVPCHLNRVDFVWDYLGQKMKMEFIGGILGREDIGGYVTPRLGFAVVHKEEK